jgi:hypothetical protein
MKDSGLDEGRLVSELASRVGTLGVELAVGPVVLLESQLDADFVLVRSRLGCRADYKDS